MPPAASIQQKREVDDLVVLWRRVLEYREVLANRAIGGLGVELLVDPEVLGEEAHARLRGTLTETIGHLRAFDAKLHGYTDKAQPPIEMVVFAFGTGPFGGPRRTRTLQKAAAEILRRQEKDEELFPLPKDFRDAMLGWAAHYCHSWFRSDADYDLAMMYAKLAADAWRGGAGERATARTLRGGGEEDLEQLACSSAGCVRGRDPLHRREREQLQAIAPEGQARRDIAWSTRCPYGLVARGSSRPAMKTYYLIPEVAEKLRARVHRPLLDRHGQAQEHPSGAP